MVQGVLAGAADNLQPDAEGGAETKTSKTRYLRSGIAVGLAAATHEDEPLNRAEGGAGGFKVVGIVIGATVAFAAFGYCNGRNWGRPVDLQQLHGTPDRCCFRKTYSDGIWCRYARCSATGNCESCKQQQSSLTLLKVWLANC